MRKSILWIARRANEKSILFKFNKEIVKENSCGPLSQVRCDPTDVRQALMRDNSLDAVQVCRVAMPFYAPAADCVEGSRR